jgi:hypothetical protein
MAMANAKAVIRGPYPDKSNESWTCFVEFDGQKHPVGGYTKEEAKEKAKELARTLENTRLRS